MSKYDKPLLSASDVAEMLQVSKETIWRMCRRGEIPAAKIGAHWFVPRERLLQHVEMMAAGVAHE